MNTLEQIQEILGTYKLESNIPMGHCYWDLLDKYRAGVLDTNECVYNAPLENPPPPLPPQAQDAARLALLRTANRLILQSVGGRESNVPFTSDYWFNANIIKSIERQPVA